MPSRAAVDTEEVVEALCSLVIFGPNQAGAFREHSAMVTTMLGQDVKTRLHGWLGDWALSGEPGLVILTGNAGTGKTAATQHYCHALGETLPQHDSLVEVGNSLVAKDASGIPSRPARVEAFREALREMPRRQVLMCVNEGVLRDAADDLKEDAPEVLSTLEEVMKVGVSRQGHITAVNLNRQRLTGKELWSQILDYVTRPELWHGCAECPGEEDGSNCPMRTNAKSLQNPATREVIRSLLRACNGEVPLTFREILALIAYMICGKGADKENRGATWNCAQVRQRYSQVNVEDFTVESAYYNLLFGVGLSQDAIDESPLLAALSRLACGPTADLEVDGWLRDTESSPPDVGPCSGAQHPPDRYSGTESHLVRVNTTVGNQTFHEIGETVTISDDPERVRSSLESLVGMNRLQATPAIWSWRRNILLGASNALGGADSAASRLSANSKVFELMEIAEKVESGKAYQTELASIVRGLNFLVAGFSGEGTSLIIPDSASLFARNPASFQSAQPSFLFGTVSRNHLKLEVPDSSALVEYLDLDHVEIELTIASHPDISLTIGPTVYQAIAEADLYRGPSHQGATIMTDLRFFYEELEKLDDVNVVASPVDDLVVASMSGTSSIYLPDST